MHWLSRIFWLVILLTVFAQLVANAKEPPTDADIKALLRERVDVMKRNVGIVVGIIDDQRPRIISYGSTALKDGREVDGDTVFEIGSISKVFTSIILADMVEHGEVKLDDHISKYLPASVKVPSRNGREITLVDLATHTSGLPRLPENLSPADDKNPYADYTVAQLYDFLSNYTLTRDIGAKYEYSNLGGGLLGHVLALRAGTNYEELALNRVCRPLGMTNTCITLSSDLRARLAQGYNEARLPTANWDLPTLAGAGGLRSTANDLLKLAAAAMGRTKTTLQPAFELAETPRQPAGSPTMKIGLGWHIAKKYGAELVWHNGGTGGYRSFIGFNKEKQTAIVVLANSANDIDDLGFYLLDNKYKLEKFPAASNRVAIPLDEKILDGYRGQYQLAGGAIFNVRRSGSYLQAQLTGQSYLDLYPESATNFFYTDVDAQITFYPATNGAAASLVLHQNGMDQTAPKISEEIPRERIAIKFDHQVFDAKYAGVYQLQPGVTLTIKRQGEKYFVKLTGQSFLEIFPETKIDFFLKVVDAQLTFIKNAQGEITSVILHQNGIDQTAKKISNGPTP